ncbi:Cu(I)-responsive transcriptional regulator [Lysobacter sp. N42]|uniref:Cu(I)-responsive transcriptional regulator n=1 Tax=Lysobacter sp. N42 TaxID=2545719 RepID=UPI001046967A|nr:Cu(I)-responsive transcriptional regulator [Lysobacter sp. N42]TCZ82051.1 Cu(I)-responsive transcriptional regulator [Lysobacter sp. N42]
MPRELLPTLAQAGTGGLHPIGEAARLSGVSAKMIRHYESIGLLPAAARTDAGYRLYSDADVHRLRFVRRARDLGFPIMRIAGLLDLWADRGRASADVRALALAQADALEARIRQMQAMRDTLLALAQRCQGDDRPDCPILDDLARTPAD